MDKNIKIVDEEKAEIENEEQAETVTEAVDEEQPEPDNKVDEEEPIEPVDETTPCIGISKLSGFSIKEQRALKEAEEKVFKQFGMDSQRKSLFEKQLEKYRIQQLHTTTGMKVDSVIEKMAADMEKIVGIKFKTGKLIPLKNAKTGEIIQFTEE